MTKKSVYECREDGDIETLSEYLKNGDVEERADSAKALGLIGDEKGTKYLIDALDDGSALVRANTALALGQIGGQEVVEHLLNALEDDSWEVRHDAVIALGEVGGKDAVEGLGELIKEESEFEIKEKILESLGKIGEKDAVEVLKGYIDEEELHPTLARSLSSIDDENVIKPLIKLFQDGDRDTRVTVVDGLSKIEKESSLILDTLLQGLKDDIWRVREESAKALGDLGYEEALDDLIGILEDENDYVIEAGLESLGKLGDGAIVEDISVKMDDQEASVRIASAEALGEIGDEDAVEKLLERLDVEENPRVLWSISDALSNCDISQTERLRDEMEVYTDERKYALASALGRCGDKKAVATLLDGVKDNRWKIRQKSVEGLQDIDLEEVSNRDRESILANLRGKLEDDDKWVRQRAVKVLGEKVIELYDSYDVDKEIEALKERADIESDRDVLEVLDGVILGLDSV